MGAGLPLRSRAAQSKWKSNQSCSHSAIAGSVGFRGRRGLSDSWRITEWLIFAGSSGSIWPNSAPTGPPGEGYALAQPGSF